MSGWRHQATEEGLLFVHLETGTSVFVSREELENHYNLGTRGEVTDRLMLQELVAGVQASRLR